MKATETEKLVVGIMTDVAAPPERRDRLILAVESAGASAEVMTEATAISQSGAVDVVLFDLGIAPALVLPIIASLESEPRTSVIPRILLIDPNLPASQLAELGNGSVVFTPATHATLVGAIMRALEQVRARSEIQRLTRVSAAALREVEQTLSRVQREGSALSHDVRVLFGVILGFAGNLRDGFAGTITDQQREHLISIVEATEDASGLIARYAEALQRAELNALDAAASIPRQATRRHVDVSTLARGTVAMFQGVATMKRIVLELDAERAAHAWCDPLQVKQALVNLVNNALKFTPIGGKVTVVARLGAPASARGGVTERREVELLVTDSGPGIPESERLRVFERGARLERDQGIPGTGQGLAIVRDVAEMHGGSVRAEASAEGGAAIVLAIPTDRRTRSREFPAVTISSAPPRSQNGPPSSSSSPPT